MRYIESINGALHQSLDENADVYVLGEDIVDPYGGAFKATKGLSSKHPGRVLSTPICEATICGMATGMALRGMRPVVEIMFGDFITLCVDQIVNHACKFPGMYNNRVTVPIVIRTPMGGGRGYGPTHSQSLEKLLLGTPHLDVVAPSHFHDPGEMLKLAIGKDHPVLFIENKLLYPEQIVLEDSGPLIRRSHPNASFEYGDVVVSNFVRLEPDVTIVAYGGLSRLLAPVLYRMAEEEIRLSCVFAGCLSPLSPETLDLIVRLSSVTNKLLLIEEGSAAFGWTAGVLAALSERSAKMASVQVRRLGAANTVIPTAHGLESKVLVSEESIEDMIKRMILL